MRLVTADGRLLKATSANPSASGLVPWPLTQFDSVFTDRTDALEADVENRLVSYSDVYETQPVVGAAINKLTRQAATLPLKVYRRLEGNERERLIDHPLADLLSKPVPRAGPVHLKQWLLMPLLTHGNALLAKFRETPDGPPVALLPVDWRYVEAFAPQGGPVEMWATTQTGERRWFDVDDSVHVAWWSPKGEIGVSPLSHLQTTVRTEDAAQRYQKSIFKNMARPTSAITTPEGVALTDDIRREIRADLEKLHASIDNAGRPALLPGGAKWEAIAHTAQEAELIAQRYVAWEEIQIVFDLPGPLLGDLRHGTYSNVTELHKQLYKSVLRPWLTLIEETIQAHLIDPEPGWEGLFVEFDAGEVLKGDPKDLAEALKIQVEAGLISRNEARKFLNMPRDPSPQADQLTVNANNQAPLASTGEAPTGPPPDGEPPKLP